MRTLRLSFRFGDRFLGSDLLITADDLSKGYDRHSALDRNFSPFYREVLTDNLNNNVLSLEAQLDVVPLFSRFSLDDISIATTSYSQLYERQKGTTLPPRRGLFDSESLRIGRSLFKSLNDGQRRLLLILADYLGNERLIDLLGYLYAQYLDEKTFDEVRAALLIEGVSE